MTYAIICRENSKIKKTGPDIKTRFFWYVAPHGGQRSGDKVKGQDKFPACEDYVGSTSGRDYFQY